jgi:hypothetical protein
MPREISDPEEAETGKAEPATPEKAMAVAEVEVAAATGEERTTAQPAGGKKKEEKQKSEEKEKLMNWFETPTVKKNKNKVI